jgi:hypothetical protein
VGRVLDREILKQGGERRRVEETSLSALGCACGIRRGEPSKMEEEMDLKKIF